VGVEVIWTETAIFQLDVIFDYYKHKATIKVAKNIVKKLVDKTLFLEKHPDIGQIELLLDNKSKIYRYLVEGNYKIIYWSEKSVVYIASVFDCRQNPIKINESIN